jgi:hypothetical protein
MSVIKLKTAFKVMINEKDYSKQTYNKMTSYFNKYRCISWTFCKNKI